jgi:hypothetical protein
MMDDGLTPLQRAFLDSQRHKEAFEEMSAVEINRMSFAEFAARSGRRTPAQAAVAALDANYTALGSSQQKAPAPPQSQTPQGVDIASMSMADYSQIRGQLGVGGREYGRGALDGGGTADWIAAAQRKAGRSGWQGRNVIEAPKLEGRFADHEALRDTRSAQERFSTPGNSFNL